MKKIFTLCLFVGAMLLGSQSIAAQNNTAQDLKEINKVAAEKTEELRLNVKFSNEQRDEIYSAFQKYGKVKASFKVYPSTSENVERNEKELQEKIKSILDAEQYERYLAYIKAN